ncbi:alpha/beta fold hydrolase [Streptomyces sp. WAC05374]|nr:alpha/beta fold hydrolase [Streptomyces sp. WAC05374]TDF50291.1 alpha/beta fold hydrolase [Streptomyces sp. WAC05374]TDF58015.1 alpha/beta fold hydrolase [Streptomyces sp. WAC05374]TDF60543.1 alpha/beta fold hydrolase [Streptomyces sp. WAC05374]
MTEANNATDTGSETGSRTGRGAQTPASGGSGRSRRTVLRAAVAGAGAVASVGAATTATVAASTEGAADRRRHRSASPTFVLVHGSGSNSYGWSPLVGELALRGHRSVAVDLPGHGPGAYFPLSYQAPQDLERLSTEPSPLGEVTLADFAEHVTGVVRRAHRNGPVVLVGQSMGGATLNAVANQVPELLAHLVYASAFCPAKTATVMQLMLSTEGLTSVLLRLTGVPTPRELGVNRVNWRSNDPGFFRTAKEALAGGYPDDEVRALLNILEPDESAAVAEADARGLPERWGRVPRTFLRFTEDRAIPLALQDRMIREADELTPGNRFRVRSLAAPHIGPRDPALLADELERVARLCS